MQLSFMQYCKKHHLRNRYKDEIILYFLFHIFQCLIHRNLLDSLEIKDHNNQIPNQYKSNIFAQPNGFMRNANHPLYENSIILHAAFITRVPKITLTASEIITTILVESRYRLAISLFSYPKILVMEIAFSFFSMISFVRR